MSASFFPALDRWLTPRLYATRLSDHVQLVLDKLVPPPDQFSVESWQDMLETFYGRAILIRDYPLPHEFFGACLIVNGTFVSPLTGTRYPAAQIILISNRLYPLHHEHILLHELGHVALADETLVIPEEALRDRARFHALLAQSDCISCRLSHEEHKLYLEHDMEAEHVARIIQQRLLDSQPQRLSTHPQIDAWFEDIFRAPR